MEINNLKELCYMPKLSRNDDILSEYNVILTFANNLLSENIHIDMEIQNIIDEHFWDML